MSRTDDSLNRFIRALNNLADIPTEETKKLYASGRANPVLMGDFYIRAIGVSI